MSCCTPLPTPAANLAPQVSVSGKKRITTTRSRIRLRGTASDDVAVSQVTVGNKVASGTTKWTAQVRLKRGVNRIKILAADGVGKESPAITVRVSRKAS